MTTRFASRFAVLAAAALIGTGGVALAQSFHHGPRGGGDFVMSIVKLKSQLNLNSSQQTMWDNAIAAGKAARQSAHGNMQKVHEALTTELAKSEPDLSAVAAASDSAQSANTATRQQVRAAWLNLYSTFTPDQKALVKTSLQQRVARMEQMQQNMQQKMLQRGSQTN